MKNKILLTGLLIFFFSATMIFAQSNYKQLMSKEGVSFFVNENLQEADGKQPLAVRIINSNAWEVEVEWIYHLWYNGNCRSCMVKEPDNFYFKKIKILANGKFEHDYSFIDKDGMQILKKFNKSNLTKIEFADVCVVKIEPNKNQVK